MSARSRSVVVLSAVLAVVGAIFAVHRWAPRRTPAGQPPLAVLSPETMSSLAAAFNAARDKTRLLVLLSPTCGTCLRGADAIESLAKEMPEPLDIVVVWEPVLRTDIAPPTTATLARIDDARAVQFWDPDRSVSAALLQAAREHPDQIPPDLAPRIRPDTIVWDFVGVYPPGVEWKGGAPLPTAFAFPVARHIEEVRRALASNPSTSVSPERGEP